MNKIILSLNNIKKNYHDKDDEIKAIKNISFDLYDKEILVILGPSGCGKSTLLSILSNLENKSYGDILINGKKKFSLMLQSSCLFPWKNILDNCLIGLDIESKVTKENINKVKYLLNKYGLNEFINKYPDSLSGGMKQRVALIRTIATNPDILLLDEPFSKLDYETRLSLLDDMYSIIKDNNKSAIMITHDISEALMIADRIIVLSKRPSYIKKIYKLNFKKDKPSSILNNIEFNKYYNQIKENLDV